MNKKIIGTLVSMLLISTVLSIAVTGDTNNIKGNGQSAPLSPVSPPEKPIQVADGPIGCHPHDHPNDMNKGIGKVPCLIYPSHGLVQTFSTTSTNPYNGMYYRFFFGDGTDSGWLGPYNAGQTATATHDYNAVGFFQVTAEVKLDVIVSNPSPPLTVRMYYTGDINGDGCIGFGDINPFVLVLSSSINTYYAAYPNAYYWAADINLDCSVNFGDINPFVALIVQCSNC